MGSALAESLDVALVSAPQPLSEGSIHGTGTDRGLQRRSTTKPTPGIGGHIQVELVWSTCRHCVNLGGSRNLPAQGNRTFELLQVDSVNLL